MSLDLVLTAASALALVFYLFYVLANPERF